MRACEDKRLLKKIQQHFQNSHGRYGSPRIHAMLKRQGIAISRKRVARLMRLAGLIARANLVTYRQVKLRQFQTEGRNLRLHSPETTTINQQWVSDLTYLKVRSGRCYLTTIMDLHSRRIISWRLSKTKMADDTLIVLRRAIAKRKPDKGLIFHTDRGVEFMAYAVQDLLKKYGYRNSYNRAGHCIDNSHMESFYHSMKTEMFRGNQFDNKQQLHWALQSYIDQFYNRKRLHSSLNYHSPAEYETMAA